MELECEMVTRGIHAGNADGYADPRVPALKASAKDWRLLLQLKSDKDLDWMWGDVGMIYYWCREDDIAQARFERALGRYYSAPRPALPSHHFSSHGRSATSNAQVERCWRWSCR
jgi:hypothetical protein